jgi:hypothetical protein
VDGGAARVLALLSREQSSRMHGNHPPEYKHLQPEQRRREFSPCQGDLVLLFGTKSDRLDGDAFGRGGGAPLG